MSSLSSSSRSSKRKRTQTTLFSDSNFKDPNVVLTKKNHSFSMQMAGPSVVPAKKKSTNITTAALDNDTIVPPPIQIKSISAEDKLKVYMSRLEEKCKSEAAASGVIEHPLTGIPFLYQQTSQKRASNTYTTTTAKHNNNNTSLSSSPFDWSTKPLHLDMTVGNDFEEIDLPDFYTAEDCDTRENTTILKSSAVSQQSVATCLTTSENNRYVAIGDTMGYITILATTVDTPRVIKRIETSIVNKQHLFKRRTTSRKPTGDNNKNNTSCDDSDFVEFDDAEVVYQRYKNLHLKNVGLYSKKTGFVSREISSIESLKFNCDNSCIIFATKFELEMIDLGCYGDKEEQRVLWRVDFLTNSIECGGILGKTLKIDCHPTDPLGSTLVGFHCYPDISNNSSNNIMDETHSVASSTNNNAVSSEYTPLILCGLGGVKPVRPKVLDRSTGDDLMMLPTADRSLPLGPKATGVWHRSSSKQENCIRKTIFVNCSDYSDVMASKGNVDNVKQNVLSLDATTFQVLHRFELPRSSKYTNEIIAIHPNGETIIAASAGSGIHLLASDDLRLLAVYGEGISLHRQKVIWQDIFFANVSPPDENNGLASSFITNTYICGVPHSLQDPQEMRTSIHLWDIDWHDKRLPTTTICGSEGFHSVCYLNGLLGDKRSLKEYSAKTSRERILAVTIRGDFIEYKQRVASNFSGIMFPKGYIIIDDNIEYIEDEDEVDLVLDDERSHEGDIPSNYSIDESESFIDIVGDSSIHDSIIIPCKPERYLQGFVNMGNISQVSASRSDSHHFLAMLPDIDANEEDIPPSAVTRQEIDENLLHEAGKWLASNKKVSTSLNFEERRSIADRELCSQGKGTMYKVIKHNDIDCNSNESHGDKFCLACKLRFNIHTCGKRILPTDQEALAKERALLEQLKMLQNTKAKGDSSLHRSNASTGIKKEVKKKINDVKRAEVREAKKKEMEAVKLRKKEEKAAKKAAKDEAKRKAHEEKIAKKLAAKLLKEEQRLAKIKERNEKKEKLVLAAAEKQKARAQKRASGMASPMAMQMPSPIVSLPSPIALSKLPSPLQTSTVATTDGLSLLASFCSFDNTNTDAQSQPNASSCTEVTMNGFSTNDVDCVTSDKGQSNNNNITEDADSIVKSSSKSNKQLEMNTGSVFSTIFQPQSDNMATENPSTTNKTSLTTTAKTVSTMMGDKNAKKTAAVTSNNSTVKHQQQHVTKKTSSAQQQFQYPFYPMIMPHGYMFPFYNSHPMRQVIMNQQQQAAAYFRSVGSPLQSGKDGSKKELCSNGVGVTDNVTTSSVTTTTDVNTTSTDNSNVEIKKQT